MEKISWGIIGCGDVTEVKSGPAFNKVPNSSLVAVMRRDEEKCKDYANRHGVPKWYTDAQQLINDPEVNAIYIATPPINHAAFAIAALKAGKPVYVEKPMATSKSEAEQMAAFVKETGVQLSVAHYRRELPLFKRVKEILANDELGEIKLVNLQMLQPNNAPLITQTHDNWRVNPAISGGGLFHDLAPHQLDLMLYFFGPVSKAFGISLNQGNYYAADDIVQGTLLFENKVIFSGVWCFTVSPAETMDKCEIIGAKGKMTFSIFRHNSLQLDIDGLRSEEIFEVPTHIQQPMIDRVVKYFKDEGENPCSVNDGVEVMRLIDAFTSK